MSNFHLVVCLAGNAISGNPYIPNWKDTFTFGHLGYGCPGNVEEWHTMGLLWTPNSLKFYQNGQQFHQIDPNEWISPADKSANPFAPFDQDFYLVLNYAFGGEYAAFRAMRPLSASDFPARLEIDWVRFWGAPGY